MPDPPTIFVSYSHEDERYKDYVVGHLQVSEKQGLFTTWDDSRIGGGENWRAEIDTALATAKVAILLVSHNSLRSDFILDREVSAILQRRSTDGVAMYPIVIRDCDWKVVDWLKAMNLRPKDGKPLAKMSVADRDSVMAEISREIRGILDQTEGRQLPVPGPGKIAEVLGAGAEDCFLYLNPFTAKKRSVIPPSHIPVFGSSRALKDADNWEHETTASKKILAEWFRVDNLRQSNPSWTSIEKAWVKMFGGTVDRWKGKRGNIELYMHPYIKMMYPYIIVGRTTRMSVSRALILNLQWTLDFLTPVLSATNNKSKTTDTFALEHIFVYGNFAYIDSHYTINDNPRRKSRIEYTVIRKAIIAKSGIYTYSVLAGIPYLYNSGDNEYIGHVDRWLREFQLGREADRIL